MILLWGLQSDETLAWVGYWLREKGAGVYFLDHSAIDRTRMSYSAAAAASNYQLYHDDEPIALDKVTAAYLRPYDFRQYPQFQQEPALTESAIQVHNLMNSWSETTTARVINPPSAEATNHSKVFQSRLIHQTTGLPVPPTLISNHWETIRQFAQEHGGTLVYKSLSCIRSVAKQIIYGELQERQDPIAPALFQKKITGTNVRVHVVGLSTFACAIHTDVLDYRYGPRMIQEMTLPPHIHDKCLSLTRHLGLQLAGIDLIVTSAGEWYCLEANPNPGFSFYDTSKDQPIARAVAELLLSITPPTPDNAAQ